MPCSLDFETYSEAGFIYDPFKNKWAGVMKNSKGLPAVGAYTYAEHPSTEVIVLKYDIDGYCYTWYPTDPPPEPLLQYVAGGGLLEAANSFFEWSIWNLCCVRRYGWPPLPITQLRCSLARARAFSLPGKLEKAVEILGVGEKDMEGNRLMKRLSVPRQPTKKDPRVRITRADDPESFARVDAYCEQDVAVEKAAANLCPPLPPDQEEVWLYDQIINARGVGLDTAALADCIHVFEASVEMYTKELVEITGGEITSASQVQKFRDWLAENGANLPNMQADTVDTWLEDNEGSTSPAYRALEIRALIASASVKKLYSMRSRVSSDQRIHDLFVFAGATRTGRWSGAAVQPQNMPNKAPPVRKCASCGTPRWSKLGWCPACLSTDSDPHEWGPDCIELAFKHLKTRNLDFIVKYWGNPVKLIVGVLRSLFAPAPGNRLIGADFSAIEAVVLAAIAGEEWRLEVFRTHGRIYEMSASLITGTPFQEIMDYKKQTGVDHPLRKTVGKVAELASGYQGGIGAWKQFGADKFLSDDEIRESVRKWRNASPAIPALWKGLENAAMYAIQSPGHVFSYRSISYIVQDHPGVGQVLHCILPSGRHLHYFHPRIEAGLMPWRDRNNNPVFQDQITFWGWDSQISKWCKIFTHGGKLTENVVQAISKDLQAEALVRSEKAGYPVVLHVHDEIISEVLKGSAHSVEEFENLMSVTPEWAKGWPIRSAGWTGAFYRKG